MFITYFFFESFFFLPLLDVFSCGLGAVLDRLLPRLSHSFVLMFNSFKYFVLRMFNLHINATVYILD